MLQIHRKRAPSVVTLVVIHSSFSQTHKIGNIGIIANFVYPMYLQFPSLFVPYDVSKRGNNYQWV